MAAAVHPHLARDLVNSLSDNKPTQLTECILMKIRDINAFDVYDYSLLHHLVTHGNVLLLKFVAEKRKDINLDAFNPANNTALTDSLMYGKIEVAKALITLGADPNKSNYSKSTPLHLAVLRGDLDLFTTVLNHCNNINARNESDTSALDYTVQNNNKQMAYKLLRAGVNVNSQNCKGHTAFYHSKVEVSAEIACMLLYYGADPNLFRKDSFIRALKSEVWNLFEVLCFSYDCMNKHIFRSLTEATLMYRMSTCVGIVGGDYYNTPKLIKIFEKFCDIMNTLASFGIHEYDDSKEQDRHYYAYLFEIFNKSNDADNLRLIWLSLSVGINCGMVDAAIYRHGYGNEVLALIWGSSRKPRELSSVSELYCTDNLWKFFHEDVESIGGRDLLRKVITSGSHENICRMFIFFTHDFYRRHDGYESRLKIKTLAELSRNASRVFIMKRFATKSFYDVHEVVNNLEIPKRMKRFLQFRIPVNCSRNCKVMWCDCDVNELAKSLACEFVYRDY